MKYATIFSYSNDKAAIAEARPRHREYLAGLKAQGKLFAAGPFPDDSGALIVYDAASREEVEQIITADPFRQAGVFQSWTIYPWNQVL